MSGIDRRGADGGATVVDETGEKPVNLDATFLPTGRMRQLTSVSDLTGGKITGEVELSQADWIFANHFPGDPVFPGSLLVEAAGQLVAVWAWAEGQRGRPRLLRSTARFTDEVGPDQNVIRLEANVRKRRQMNFGEVSILAGGRETATVEVALAVIEAV